MSARSVLLGQRPLLARSRRAGGVKRVLTFPTTPLTVKVMLAFGADPSADPRTSFSWTDITRYVLQRDRIRIRRGRSDEQASQTQPSQCTLTFRNVAGRFSPRNPNGPYYGAIGKNTPLRVDVDPGTGPATRFVGFISEWPPRWDVTDRNSSVTVTANGVLRRIGQGAAPINSLTRSTILYFESYFTSLAVVGYWPLEDGSSASTATSGIAGGQPMAVRGSIAFAAVTPPAGSAAAPNVSAGALTGTMKPSTSGEWCIEAYYQAAGDCRVLRWSTSTVAFTLDVSATTVTVTASDGTSGTVTLATTDRAWHAVEVIGLANHYTIVVDGNLGGGTLSTLQVGDLTTVTANPLTDADLISVNHLAAVDHASNMTNATIMAGDPGTSTALNVFSIAAFNGLHVDVSNISGGETMALYPTGTLLEALTACAEAEEGFLVERLDGRLGFDLHDVRENQPVALALDYNRQHIAQTFEPADDDRLVRNDVSITRTNASTQRYVDQSTSTLSINTVGRYDTSATLNVYTDVQALQHAAYQVVHGTVDEPRFPRVNLNFTRNPSLIAPWLACDIGDRVTISNPPGDLPPDVIDQVIEGYTEIIDPFMWTVELNLSPLPFRIFRMSTDAGDPNDFIGYQVPASCTLAADLDTTSTSVNVTSDTLWSTNSDDWTPAVPIYVDGERMTVSAVSGGSNPQTLTVARSLNTVVKAHSSGATLTFATPGIMTL